MWTALGNLSTVSFVVIRPALNRIRMSWIDKWNLEWARFQCKTRNDVISSVCALSVPKLHRFIEWNAIAGKGNIDTFHYSKMKIYWVMFTSAKCGIALLGRNLRRTQCIKTVFICNVEWKEDLPKITTWMDNPVPSCLLPQLFFHESIFIAK